MGRRPALLTQAEVARVIRAARTEGCAEVIIRPDGTVVINLSPTPTAPEHQRPSETEREIVL